MKTRFPRLGRLVALAALTCAGTMHQACLTRVRDDFMLGLRTYFIQDFIPSLGCFLVPEGSLAGCEPATTE